MVTKFIDRWCSQLTWAVWLGAFWVGFHYSHRLGWDEMATKQLLEKDNLIDRYQTLITGILAVAVGWLSIRAVNRQIKVEDNQRYSQRLSALHAYRAAVEDMLKRIDRVIRIAYRTNHVDENFRTAQGGQLVNMEFRKIFWDYLPTAVPTIVTDWSYLANLPAGFVSDAIKIRGDLDTLIRMYTTLNAKFDTAGDAKVLTTRWKLFVEGYKETFNNVREKFDCYPDYL